MMVSPSNKQKIKAKQSTKENKHSKQKPNYKPLQNKRYYLDITNYKGLENLKKDLIHLGAIIEEFISKEVHYLITTRLQSRELSSETQSSIFSNSPTTPVLSSIQSQSCDSPQTFDSSRGDGKRKFTRSELLLEKACLKRQGTSDVLENAKQFGIEIWSLSKLLKFVASLKDSTHYRPHKHSTSGCLNTQKSISAPNLRRTSTPSSSRKLKTFIKIEDFKRVYRPQYKEVHSWPQFNINCPIGVSPFSTRTNSKSENKKVSAHKDTHNLRKAETAKAQKSGYCELCAVSFTNLKLHLKSESHVTFVRDNKNYAELDSFATQFDMSQF